MTPHPDTEIVKSTSSLIGSSPRVTTTTSNDPAVSPEVTSTVHMETTTLQIGLTTDDVSMTSGSPVVNTTTSINSVTTTLITPTLTTQPVFDSVNRCLRSYINRHDSSFEMEDLELWDGTFNDLLEKIISTSLPEFILAPEMDVLLAKMHFLWKYDIQSCERASRDLCDNYQRINEEILNSWSTSECQDAPIINDFDQIQVTLYHFRPEAELSFEFLQLRQWLIGTVKNRRSFYPVLPDF